MVYCWNVIIITKEITFDDNNVKYHLSIWENDTFGRISGKKGTEILATSFPGVSKIQAPLYKDLAINI